MRADRKFGRCATKPENWAVLSTALILAACASAPSPEPRVITKEVKVEVPVSCVPKSLPGSPNYPDTRAALQAAPSAEDRLRLLGAGWFVRDARLTVLEGVVRACR